MKTDQHLRRTAMLVAVASILQVAESFLPNPFPGIRLGLANMITLVAIVRLGPLAAIEIAAFRTVVSSFVLGTFLSPAFILSFLAALASSSAMCLFHRLITLNGKPRFSIVGVSLVGSLTHNLAQIGLVYMLIVRNAGVFILLPWLGISAVVMGWISGLIAMGVCRRLDTAGHNIRDNIGPDETPESQAPFPTQVTGAASVLTTVPGAIKVGVALAIAVAALALKGLATLGGLLALVFILILVAKFPLGRILRTVVRILPFVLFGFAMPVLFSGNGAILWTAGPLTITDEGLRAGEGVALRLLLLMMSAALLVGTTPPDQLARGLATLLAPLRLFRVPVDRIAATISLSLASIPVAWRRSRATFRLRNPKGRGVKQAMDELVGAVATMYEEAERDDPKEQDHSEAES